MLTTVVSEVQPMILVCKHREDGHLTVQSITCYVLVDNVDVDYFVLSF